MASINISVVLFAALVAALCLGASAQSNSCTSALIGLSPCLNYITGNDSTPSSSCCSQLASVVKSEPQCLCTVLNGGAASSLGITVNQTQALALPGACNVQTPAASQCGEGKPSGSPSTSTPSGSGTKTVPVDIGLSDGSFLNVPFLLIFSLVFVVAASLSPLTAV